MSLLGLLWLSGCNGTTPTTSSAVKERIGIYDSRAIALAYTGTEWFKTSVERAHADEAKAKAEKDEKLMAEVTKQGVRFHQQGFSTAPVDDLLAHIKDKLPSVTQAAGVCELVSKWDKEALAKHQNAEQVDVTEALVNAMTTDPALRKTALEMMKSKPISMEDAAKPD